MWKTGLVAAAVGIGTLVAVIVIGLPLVEPETAPEPPPAATTALRSWAERASDQCEEALGTVRAELAGAPGLTTTSGMRTLFRDLGATGCIRYLDPASYG